MLDLCNFYCFTNCFLFALCTGLKASIFPKHLQVLLVILNSRGVQEVLIINFVLFLWNDNNEVNLCVFSLQKNVISALLLVERITKENREFVHQMLTTENQSFVQQILPLFQAPSSVIRDYALSIIKQVCSFRIVQRGKQKNSLDSIEIESKIIQAIVQVSMQ